ncbi:MAG TPA: SusC/RagA family protein, partial [Porphyromonadaceae bacterium]|nr:SusC/RagA family protein [Porphyromonadaceae bacterium]
MKRNVLVLLSLLLFKAGIVLSQTQVYGTVLDEDREPVIGATVQVKDSSRGTITDTEGRFRLSAPPGGTLVVSYIGAKTQEVAVSENLTVILEADAQELDEVIVVAYGTASKAGYTGSASTVNEAAISRAQVSSVSRLLQGAASGVQSVASSGQPGSDASVYIRGIGSINASSTPLYIVDGAPYDGNLNSINPADIESISVLKDAASTALYGSRAGNGLIIITTKQGKKDGKAVIEGSFKHGVSSRAVADYKKIGTNDYFELYWEALRNRELYGNEKPAAEAAKIATEGVVPALGINPYGSEYPLPVGLDGRIVDGAVPLWDDDWTAEYTRPAYRTEGQLSASGGTSNSTYFVSLGYLDDRGIALASDFKRYSGRLNLNAELRPWLKLFAGLSLSHSKQNAPQSQDSSTDNTLNFARLIPNFYPIWERTGDGSFKLDDKGDRIFDYGSYRPSAASPKYNHLGSSQYDFSRIVRDLASIRTSLDVRLYKGLSYKGSINIDYTNKNDHYYTNPQYGYAADNENPGDVSKYNYRTVGFTGNNILTYTASLNDVHNIKVLAGQEYYEYNTSNIWGSKSGFPILGLEEPAAASVLNDFSGNSDRYKLLSYFANGEYNYAHTYYGSASVRRDASSRFAPESRWGTFWSVGASWRVSEEAAIKDIPAISSLTLRSSYGGQGNDNIGTYYAYKAL